MPSKKPNIIVYLSDDHGWEYLGCYGDAQIQTPCLDSLAEVWNSWVEKAETDPQTAQLVYLTQHHPVEELYDVTTDPYEFNNLAFSPEVHPILEEMRTDVRRWMHTQDDEGRREHAT